MMIKTYKKWASLLTISLLLLSSVAVSAQFSYRGFSGGMMIHTGYLKSGSFGTPSHTIQGMPFGLGGTLKFHFGGKVNQLRVGMEGFSSSISYSDEYSYFSTGSGGVTVDYFRQREGISPFVGLNFGGGKNKNHTLVGDDIMKYHEYSYMALSPFLGVQIPLTKKISLISKLDWLINVTNRLSDFPSGPRIYFGIFFIRG